MHYCSSEAERRAYEVRFRDGGLLHRRREAEGEDWERDLDIGYVVQSGPLKNVSVRVRNVVARSNYRTDTDENRLILSYTIQLF